MSDDDTGASRDRGRPGRPAPGAPERPTTEHPLRRSRNARSSSGRFRFRAACPATPSGRCAAMRSPRVTVAALALPSGMAYAQLAGLSPVAGLYALLLPAVVYALLGSSRQLIVGPEAPLAIMTAGALAPIAGGDATLYAELAALLALMTRGHLRRRPAVAARMDRGLPLAPGPRRLHARHRGHLDHRTTRKAARTLDRRVRPAPPARRSAPRDRRAPTAPPSRSV